MSYPLLKASKKLATAVPLPSQTIPVSHPIPPITQASSSYSKPEEPSIPPAYKPLLLHDQPTQTSNPPVSSKTKDKIIAIIHDPGTPIQQESHFNDDSSEICDELSDKVSSNFSASHSTFDPQHFPIKMVHPGGTETSTRTDPFVKEVDDSQDETSHRSVPKKKDKGAWFSFSFNDIPFSKWRDRLHDFSAWIDIQMKDEHADLHDVISDFIARMTGTLREWFQNLSDYEKI